MHDEQLSWDFDGNDIKGEITKHTFELDPEGSYDIFLNWPKDYLQKPVDVETHCKHKVIFRSCKKDFVTYCNKCGKILSVRNRREK